VRISHRYQFVFLAYPRTASRSVREVLDAYSDIQGVHPTRTSRRNPFSQHMPAREAKGIFEDKGWDWFGYHRFCVVRNPYTRVVSLYHHHRNMRIQGAPARAPIPRLRALVKYRLERPKSFKEYVLGIDKEQGMTMPLYDFIHDDDGNCLVNDVLRFEELADGLPRYLLQLGIQIGPEEIPLVGASEVQDYVAYYDEETQSFVENLYQYEIERFGYRFEDLR
jgi:hypothetical protein